MAEPLLKAGVIGYPISHSLSPRIHNYWLKKYNITGRYEAMEVAPEELERFIKDLAVRGIRGVNVTIPHKVEVMQWLDEVTPLAKAIGAVNTVFFSEDGTLKGTNTDAYGFIQNLISSSYFANIGADVEIKTLILGAGGASRAVISGLISEGLRDIILVNRHTEKAEQVARDLNNYYQDDIIHVKPWEERHKLLERVDLLVNSTALGMIGQPELDLDLSHLPTTAIVTDIVYKPLETKLLKEAKARGNPVIDGLGMLLYQAQEGFVLWYGDKDWPEVTQELRELVLS